MLALVLTATHAHVPTYDGCIDGCCTPPHKHTTSQVVYRTGSGGLEIHCSPDDCPFDVAGNEIIDVDAVFKEEYDPTTYSLYIGCGGCVPYQDPIVIPAVHIHGYEPGELEPFTQTAYRSVFKKADRKYATGQLAHCSQNHFTIRLSDWANRTDGSTLIWAGVIGLGETFTLQELLSFPIYVLRNHGDTWNQLGFTYWVILPLTLPLWWFVRARARSWLGWKFLSPFDAEMINEPRAWLYDLSIVAFLAAGLEMFVHLVCAQTNAALGYQLWLGLFVIGFATFAPIIGEMIIWYSSMYKKRDNWVASWWLWCIPEMANALGLFLLFGSGFFIGPTLAFLAGFVRFVEDGLNLKGIFQFAFTGTMSSTAQATPRVRRGGFEELQEVPPWDDAMHDTVYPSLFL